MRTDREELIYQIADRAMDSTDPHEYVRAIATIHVHLNDGADSYRVPQCYAGTVDALFKGIIKPTEQDT